MTQSRQSRRVKQPRSRNRQPIRDLALSPAPTALVEQGNGDAPSRTACSGLAGGEAYGYPWPRLDEIGLHPDQPAWRKQGVGGSDANVILSGDAERVLRPWREKRGEAEPEDLSSVLPVMLGQWTEAFNRQWYQRQTGNVVADTGAVAACPIHDWRRCTLDGFIYAMGAIWEAKHVSGFAKPDEVLARYIPPFASRLTGATRLTDALQSSGCSQTDLG